ncbi:hypothetical protein STEG23_003815 [Scotinomys teguina]
MSESDNKEKGSLKEERPKSSKASSKLHTKVEKEKKTDQGEKEKETDQGKAKQKHSGLYPVLDEFKQKHLEHSGLYPVLDEFSDLTLSDSAEDELESEEEKDLEEAAATCEREREYPQVRIIHYMDDILLAAPSQVMLDKAYAHTVQALEKKGLYIAPEKVQKDSIAECWNGTWTLTVIVKVPTFVPIPVKVDPKTFPIMTLLRECRDFGITAAIIAAIVLSAAGAITSTIAMTNQIQSAQTINTVVEQTSAVMETQHRINKHLMSGIVAANQRMDLIQTQVEELFGLIQIGCIAKLKHMCVTPLRYEEAGNESRRMASYLAGNWTRDIELLMSQQLLQIAALNKTRV